MSLAYVVVLERSIEGLNTEMDGKALAHASDALDELSLELDLPLLAEFSQVDGELMREVIAEMVGMQEFADLRSDLQDLDTDSLETEDWFDAQDGLRWVQALRGHLPHAATALSSLRSVTLSDLLEDMNVLEQILERAHREKVRFHLELDF